MALGPLSKCACGHVANHHMDRTGCQVRGCPCRRFDAGHVSREHHNAVVAEANRKIAALRAEVGRLRSLLGEGE